MTTKTMPLTKSGCADAVGNTVSSADDEALLISDGGPTGTEVDTGAGGDGVPATEAEGDADGDTDVAAGSVTAVHPLASAITCPRSATSRSEKSLRARAETREVAHGSAGVGAGRL
jgi:hypothetical protein